MRRMLFVFVVGLAVVAVPATADRPYPDQFTLSGSALLTDLCSFPVGVEFNASFTGKYFFTKGVLAKIEYHIVEQDVFSANGKSLAGVPFRFNVQLRFDSTGQTRYVAQGVQQKVPLPDGSLFLAAGRIDWLAHPGVDYILLPDHGATVNLEGFCTALE